MREKIGTMLLVVLALVSRPLFAEQMIIDKQIRLSPEHRVMPYQINRASNNDLIVSGSNDQVDYRAWATRISPTGEVRWEFLEGSPEGWTDQSARGQRFYGAFELADQTTVLCGTKKVDGKHVAVLVRLRQDGSLVGENLLRPDREGVILTGLGCTNWADGLALTGTISGRPASTGWLARLDGQLNVKWQKFSDDYANGDVAQTASGDLNLISWSGGKFYLVKIGPTGDVRARQNLPDGEHHLVHMISPGTGVRVATMRATLDTEILDFDGELRGPKQTMTLHNTGVKKCLGLADGSIAIFGSEFHSGATAAITRVYKDGGHKGFIVEPAHQSGWYYDAASVGGINAFAAVRLVDDGRAVLDWVSFK